jgi:hypothetical protein
MFCTSEGLLSKMKILRFCRSIKEDVETIDILTKIQTTLYKTYMFLKILMRIYVTDVMENKIMGLMYV